VLRHAAVQTAGAPLQRAGLHRDHVAGNVERCAVERMRDAPLRGLRYLAAQERFLHKDAEPIARPCRRHIVIHLRLDRAGLNRVRQLRLAHEPGVCLRDAALLLCRLRQRLAHFKTDARAKALAEHIVHRRDVGHVGDEAQHDHAIWLHADVLGHEIVAFDIPVLVLLADGAPSHEVEPAFGSCGAFLRNPAGSR
jgi:hypothetical protein